MYHLIYPQEGYFQEMLDQGGPYPKAADQGRPHPLGASSDSVKSELVIPRMGGGQKTARETADQQPESEGLGKRTYESQSQESQPHVLQPYRTSPGRYGLEPERIVHELERLHDLGRMESPLLLKALEKTIVTVIFASRHPPSRPSTKPLSDGWKGWGLSEIWTIGRGKRISRKMGNCGSSVLNPRCGRGILMIWRPWQTARLRFAYGAGAILPP